VRHANEPGFVEILVGDDGVGIAPSDYATALARGARLDEAIPGTGFGLSIVDDLARAYKGGVSLGASDLGGLLVTLKLPSVSI
jgi:signal transduction histidine kinase